MTPRRVLHTYYGLAGLYSLASSLVWGVNTLFLLWAGLDIFGVFVASAAFTAGMVVFEIPTGVLADTWGRRLSFLLSTATLLAGTLGYALLAELHAGLAAFSAVSVLLGLAFTFYSGAVEAWLVDALRATGYTGPLDHVFARGALVTGACMVVGTVGGGFLGDIRLSLPYAVRGGLLLLLLVVAVPTMHEVGFTPRSVGLRDLPCEMAAIGRDGLTYGWRRRSVRYLIAASAVEVGFLSWGFYAWQPYFLDLLGRQAIWAAGLFSSLISLATMAGNALVDQLARFASRRTTLLLAAAVVEGIAVTGVGLARSFWLAAGLYLAASVAMGVIFPVKQAYMHEVIPSAQRATVVSVDSMVGNAGGVVGQVGLGYLSRSFSIPIGFVAGGLGTLLVLPVLGLLRRMDEPADHLAGPAGTTGPLAPAGLPPLASVDGTRHSGPETTAGDRISDPPPADRRT